MKMDFQFVVALCLFFVCVKCQPYRLSVREEMPTNTPVGNIRTDPQFTSAISAVNTSSLKFMFFGQRTQFLSFFRIDEQTGEIFTSQPIDRESICADVFTDCYIELDIAANSDVSFKIFKVRIVINDINDNSPEFPQMDLSINIPESVPINFTAPISGATDLDTGENHGVQDYEIIPNDGQFGVSVIQNLDGTPEIGVVVLRKLDREKTSAYQVRILAKDGGIPRRTGSVVVRIFVTDVNDHAPKFSQSLYNVTVKENLPNQTPITKLMALDDDTGDNGQVIYRFSSRTASKFSKVFSVNSTTGEIRVVGRVDYEKASEKLYRLVVEAVDQGAQPRSSQALVVVNVIDVNDNAPKIEYNFLPVGDKAIIPEDAGIEEFVAHVSAPDLDSGVNGEVDCRISASEFKLERLYDNEFQVSLNSKLDRESTSEYNVSLFCQDKGEPPLLVSSYFVVSVTDVNDNSPVFKLSSYIVPVKESAKVGSGILQLSASDKDVGRNGMISYEVLGTNSSYFRIDPTNGMLYIKNQVDYEATHEMTVLIKATDAGDPPKSNNATVVIRISDVNDEKPRFNQTRYAFNVTEEQDKGAVVGQVLATDPDQGLGGELQYFIRETPESKGMFSISHLDGVITTMRSIDRETTMRTRFFVVAIDKGENPLTSTVAVTVDMLDINDNSPTVHVPIVANGSFPVYTNQPTESPFIRVIAKDPDDRENGTLVYAIEDGDRLGLFHINSDNGDIFLKSNDSKGLIKPPRKDFSLLISVKDMGTPQRVTLKRLNLTVIPVNSSRKSTAEKEKDHMPINYMIVIAVICVTVFISVIIVIIIFIIRRRNKADHENVVDKGKVSQKNIKHKGETKAKNMTENDYVGEKSKKGVNFVLENESSNRNNESSTDPPTKSSLRKPVPPHDIVRAQKPLGTPNTVNVLWLDSPDSHRQHDDDLTFNIISPKNIPQTANVWLHGPRVDGVFDGVKRHDDETSNVSGETATSDSGRGGSEDDSHSRHHYSIDEQEGLMKTEPNDCSEESEYIDMQRSALSFLSAQRSNSGMSHPLPEHYNNILRRSLRNSTDSGIDPALVDQKLDQLVYTDMLLRDAKEDPVTSLPPPIPPRVRREKGPQRSNHQSPVVKINVDKICRLARKGGPISDNLTVESDLTRTTYDDDDSVTTTSGSYTIDDLSDYSCETANV